MLSRCSAGRYGWCKFLLPMKQWVKVLFDIVLFYVRGQAHEGGVATRVANPFGSELVDEGGDIVALSRIGVAHHGERDAGNLLNVRWQEVLTCRAWAMGLLQRILRAIQRLHAHTREKAWGGHFQRCFCDARDNFAVRQVDQAKTTGADAFRKWG